MKTTKILLLVFTSLLLVGSITSFQNASSASPDTPDESERCAELENAQKQLEANLEMYQTVWDEIINEGKIDEINADNFDANIVGIASPENVVGIDAFKAYYQNYLTGFSDVSFTVTDLFGQEDNIVKRWNFKGTHTGDFFGIPATGNTVDINGVTIVKMKDGKIAQEEDILDNLEFMQQLGLIPRE